MQPARRDRSFLQLPLFPAAPTSERPQRPRSQCASLGLLRDPPALASCLPGSARSPGRQPAPRPRSTLGWPRFRDASGISPPASRRAPAGPGAAGRRGPGPARSGAGAAAPEGAPGRRVAGGAEPPWLWDCRWGPAARGWGHSQGTPGTLPSASVGAPSTQRASGSSPRRGGRAGRTGGAGLGARGGTGRGGATSAGAFPLPGHSGPYPGCALLRERLRVDLCRDGTGSRVRWRLVLILGALPGCSPSSPSDRKSGF